MFTMSTFVIEVCLWYIGLVTVRTNKMYLKYRLWYNVSVPYPKPGLAENTGNVEFGAAPLAPLVNITEYIIIKDGSVSHTPN